MRLKHFAIVIFLCTLVGAICAKAPVTKLTDAWKSKIRKLAPSKATAKPAKERKVLLFSLATGFKHWVIPHTVAMVEILGEKTGAFEVVVSNDVQMFTPDKLKQFDGIILNNTCSKRPTRNSFLDALGKDKKTEAAALEKSLLDFVKRGGGLTAIHGGIVFLNNSAEFSELMGGSFDFHPPQQKVTLNLVEPDHPLLKAFGGKKFVHVDEPYLFKNAYKKKNFRPLLQMDTSLLKCGKAQKKVVAEVRYTAWIKRYGKGRVFYCSPSHNAQSFERPELLQFLLDGIQYTLGDLKCDDTPPPPPKKTAK
ncbi:MAG: ThuA domain-containing protein [bacterium]|nr:ThuA domain-containing protein [bacterium]